MHHALQPLMFAIIAWWVATGAVFLAARFAKKRAGLIVGVATGVAAMAAYWLYVSARMDSEAGVYIAFLSAIGLWGWNELTFLTGTVTGPRKSACPEGLTGRARFIAAWQAVRDHELAILGSAALAASLTFGAENLTGLWTFLVLWGMRISAKLNIFYGAPFAVNDLIPEHLRYITSYFRTDRVTGLFWFSFLSGGILVGALGHAALTTPDALVRTSCALVGTFALLGAVEHVFLITNVRDSALWTWAITTPDTQSLTLGAPANDDKTINRHDDSDEENTIVHHPSMTNVVTLSADPNDNVCAVALPGGVPLKRSQSGSGQAIHSFPHLPENRDGADKATQPALSRPLGRTKAL